MSDTPNGIPKPQVIERLQQQVDIRGVASPFGLLCADALKELTSANEVINDLREVIYETRSIVSDRAGGGRMITPIAYATLCLSNMEEILTKTAKWREA